MIDKDSTGQLWATWTEVIAGQQYVMVNSTTGGDTTWGTPFQLSTNPLDAVAPLERHLVARQGSAAGSA